MNQIFYLFRPNRVVHAHEDDAAVCRSAAGLEFSNLWSFPGKELFLSKYVNYTLWSIKVVSIENGPHFLSNPYYGKAILKRLRHVVPH